MVETALKYPEKSPRELAWHIPDTRGKIKRYHRSMKNILLLENYYSLDEQKIKSAFLSIFTTMIVTTKL